MANYVSNLTVQVGDNSSATYNIRELFPHVGTCSTAAATAAKEVTIGNFKLYTGAWVVVKFNNTNSAAVASLTLNVDGTGAKPIKYRNANLGWAGQLISNRYTYFIYDGTNYQIVSDFNSDTYDRTSNQTRIYAGTIGVFNYSLCAMDNNQRMQSFTTTSGTGTAKTFNTSASFMYPPVIMYNDANSTYADGTAIANNVLYEQYPSVDLRYSCNVTSTAGFTQYKPVYLECTINSDGTFKLTTTGLTQTFTNGKYYILLGCMYNTSIYQLALFAQHPMFYYDGTHLNGIVYTAAEKTKLSGIANGATKVESSSNGKIKINGKDTTVYSHPTHTAKTSGLYKITVDSLGHVSAATAVAKGDIPALDYLPLSGGTMTGDITFASISGDTYPISSKGIKWGGGTDAIDMYYNLRESDAGELIINMRDDSNVRISFAYNGTVKSYIDTNGTYNGNASTATKLGTANKGSTTKGIYLDAGVPKEMTYSLGSTVNTGTAKQLAYYSGANAISATHDGTNTVDSLYFKTGTNAKSARQIILGIYGHMYGNDAATLISGTAGVFSYGDGGPQIDFNSSVSGSQAGALIFTDHDAAGTGASWHFVSNQTDWNVTSKRFHARTSISIGTNTPNTSYNLYVNGTTNITGNTTIGGTLGVTGAITQNGNQVLHAGNYTSYALPRNIKHIHTASGTEGTAGWVKIARITVTNLYANHPMTFTIAQRGIMQYRIHLVLVNNESVAAAAISQFIIARDNSWTDTNNNPRAYIIKPSDGIFDLYIRKTEGYDHIFVVDFTKADGSEGENYSVTWTNVHAADSAITGGTEAVKKLYLLTTTNYAGSSSAGGAATSANKLNTNAGAANRPVYFSGGVPVQCDAPASGSWFKGVPLIGTNGCMEIGKYIDFHATNASTADYDYRIETSTTKMTLAAGGASNILSIKSSGNTQLTFQTTSSGKAYTASGIICYPLTASGMTALFNFGGNVVIGGGEAAQTLYDNDYDTIKTAEHETLYLASDSEEMHLITGAQSYAGRKVLKILGGQLTKSGGSWIAARDHAPVHSYKGGDGTSGSFYPAIFSKSKNGGWAIGTLGNADTLYASYTTDAHYSSNTNTSTYTIQFPKDSGTLALTANLDSYLPLSGGTMTGAIAYNNATTRLNSLKNLTIDNVGTSATYFLTITDSWGKGGYTSVADAKTVLGLGSAAYTASTAYLASTTKYAGSSSAGGAATSANKLNTNAGGTYLPVYFSSGVPVAVTVKNNTSLGTIGWTSGAASNAALVTVNSIAYWNGTYSGTSSNLAYCNKGAFGTIVTKSTSDYSKVSISRNLTSGTKVGTITIDGTATDLYCQTNSDTKVTQNISSGSANRPLLMSYYQTGTTTTTAQVVYRNDLIYANPSTGTITANKFYGNITGDGLNAGIYDLLNTDNPIFNGAEWMLTSIPSSSGGTSTPSFRRVKTAKFADYVNSVSRDVLFNDSTNTSRSITLSNPPTDTQYLKLYFKSSGNMGQSTMDNSVYSIAEVPYITDVNLGGILQVAQPSDNMGVLKLTALAFTIRITNKTLTLTKASYPSRLDGSIVANDTHLSANIIKVVAYR